MKLRSITSIVVFLSISIIANAQIKLHQSGGISIGSTTDPTTKKVVVADPFEAQSDVDLNSKLKIHSSTGGISIGADTDPGSNIIKLYAATVFDQTATFANTTVFSQNATFSNSAVFDQSVTFNNGSNLFEKVNAGDDIVAAEGSATFIVESGSIVSLVAGNSITLDSGCSIEIGADFSMSIESCEN